jgi:flagellin
MALNAYRNLSVTQNDLGKSLEKLSSGFRINRAADDAAGLAISEGLRSQVGGLKQAVRNAQDGISVVQTAEGALTEVHAILQRMRDLAVQGANDSNNAKARDNIEFETKELTAELDRIAKSTNFNGTKLLQGNTAAGFTNGMQFQVGADGDANSRIVVDLKEADVTAIAAQLGGAAALPGATWNDVAAVGDTVWQYNSINYGSKALADEAAIAGNANPATAVSELTVVAGNTAGTGEILADKPTGLDAVVYGGYNVSSHDHAQASITLVDKQIDQVSKARATLGAVQNRFEHTIKNVNVAVENLSASESRIRDTDMAQEMVQFTRAQILQQAGTAMLAQANQVPQTVLSLLR